MRSTRLSLANRILLLQIVIVLLTVSVGAGVFAWETRRQIDHEFAERALAVARSVAAAPIVRGAFDDPDPSVAIQPYAESVRAATGADFVVVANKYQIRYSHPNPALLGEKLSTDAGPALAGRDFIGKETGTLGPSMRAKVPVRADDGSVIGVVSVGITTDKLTDRLLGSLSRLAALLGLAVALGALGSYLVARRVKRQTYGLEPHDIAALLEQREAVLHGIREGMVAIDPGGRITMLNDEATRLLGLPENAVGRALDDLDLPPRVRDVLGGRDDDGRDAIVLRLGRVLVLNRMPVASNGSDVGAVVTLRDRTELDRLTDELDGARSTTDALRAQAHEFANRMHTVAGLIELGEYDQALSFATTTTAAQEELSSAVAEQVRDPAVAALLLAKSAAAAERGAELTISPDTALDRDGAGDPRDLLLVVGNLVDNALDALGGEPGTVEVTIRPDGEGLLVEVRDSGPGIAPDLVDEVFRHGFTTKVAQSGGQRGLGLALTRQACVRRGGWVRVRNEDGAVFTALLPAREVRR